MATVGIDPNTFEVLNGHPNKIPTDQILGGVVQNCPSCPLVHWQVANCQSFHLTQSQLLRKGVFLRQVFWYNSPIIDQKKRLCGTPYMFTANLSVSRRVSIDLLSSCSMASCQLSIFPSHAESQLLRKGVLLPGPSPVHPTSPHITGNVPNSTGSILRVTIEHPNPTSPHITGNVPTIGTLTRLAPYYGQCPDHYGRTIGHPNSTGPHYTGNFTSLALYYG